MRRFIALSTVIFISSFGSAHAGVYRLDESHTQVAFKIKHLVISTVSGRFNKFSGQFQYDPQTGKLEGLSATIDANSIDTNEPDRDKHLRSKDFFDVEKFKTIEFVSSGVTQNGNRRSTVKGNLTIHGVSKPVTLLVDFKGEATDPWGNRRTAFEAKTKVNRKDFGLNWNKNLDKGGVMIADEVEIIIEGEAILQKEKP